MLLTVLTLAPVAGFSYDWPQFNGNPQHSGNNTGETIIKRGNVDRLRKLFQVTLPSVADGSPVYLSSVTTPNGLEDLIFVTTKAGHIIALDAETGAQVWSRQNPAGPAASITAFQPAIQRPLRQSTLIASLYTVTG